MTEPTPPASTDVRADAPVRQWFVDLNRLVAVIWIAAGGLVVLEVVGSVAAAAGAPRALTRFLDSDSELNLPSSFKTTMLLVVTLVQIALWRLARRDGHPFCRGWLLLAGVSAFAFVDESMSLHQAAARYVQSSTHGLGPLPYAWTVVYVPAVFVVVVVAARYVRFLETSLRRRLLTGGVLFGLGTIGLEPVKAHLVSGAGGDGLAPLLLQGLSDAVQMLGLTVLVVVLLRELGRRAPRVDLRLC